jgi:hypothetical protein
MPSVGIDPHSILGPNVCLYDDFEPIKIILSDKAGHIKKDNDVTFCPKKNKAINEAIDKVSKRIQ